ncbi:hypothetical protein ACHAWF_010200 [Thalassiosira exigua]
MDPPPLNEQEVYEYYTQKLLPALVSSLPILLSRLARDAASFLSYFTTRFIQFLFPIWFRRWTVDTTDTIARAARDVASEGGEFLHHIWQSESRNSTVVDFILERMDLNKDGKISANEWSSNAEDLKRDVETMIHQYYHVVTDSIHNQQQTSWYAWLRTVISRLLAVDWSMGAYLWNTCSGLIIVLIITSILPGRLHGWTGRLLRFPVLGMTYMLISVELAMYTLIRFAIRSLEGVFANAKHRMLRNGMTQASSYDEWYGIAKELDRSQGREEWRSNVTDDTAYQYSWPFILELLSDLKASRENNDIIQALAVLQQCTRKNVGGVMSEDLFSFTNCGEPKQVVQEFIGEVVNTLEWVTKEVRDKSQAPPTNVNPKVVEESKEYFDKELKSKAEEERNKMLSHILEWATLGILRPGDGNDEDTDKSNSKLEGASAETSSGAQASINSHDTNGEHAKNLILREKIKTFLTRARAAYGRTALCLSGGAMMGNYHFGAVRALLETDLLPHIISGTSAGSVIGAMLCTRTEEELIRDLKPEVLAPKMSIFESSWGQRWARWYRHGTMFDQDDWYQRVKWFTCDEMTFEEAYKKTGRVFCVTLSATSKKAPPVLINYITAPNVVIASAVLASASVPGFVDAMRLKVKDENGVVRDQGKCDEEYRDGSIDSDIPTNGLAEMLNCRFFLAAQANPHIVPFFYNAKGEVGCPSRWSSGMRDDSWRGGFLLSGQSIEDMKRYFQGGRVATYRIAAMLKLHYKIAHALDDCLASLEYDESPRHPLRRRRSQVFMKKAMVSGGLHFTKLEPRVGKLQQSTASPASTVSDGYISDDEKGGFNDEQDGGFGDDDEHESGFDGVDLPYR